MTINLTVRTTVCLEIITLSFVIITGYAFFIDDWLGHLVSSLYPLLLISSLIIMISAFLLNLRFLLIVNIALCVYAAIQVGPYLKSPISSSVASNRDRIKVMVANVNNHNVISDSFVETIFKEKPDLLVLLEVTAESDDPMKKIRTIYRDAVIAPRENNWGYALFSSFPLVASTELSIGKMKRPALQTTFVGPGGEERLMIVHATPPLTPEMFKEQKIELEELIWTVKKDQAPVLVLGDFNTTMWSKNYKFLIENIRLANVRSGNGLCATWPSGWFGVKLPIDQVFYNRSYLKAVSCNTVFIPGSDHMALVAELVY